MTLEESKTLYDAYINTHISNVQQAYQELLAGHYFEGVFDMQVLEDAFHKVLPYHDESKWGSKEYDGYRQYFYPTDDEVVGESSKGSREVFKLAWLHHMHNNPHHWDYWCLLDEDANGVMANEMPDEYIIEMLCDWCSFSVDKGDLGEVVNWFNEKCSRMTFYAETKNKVLTVLSRIANDTGRTLDASTHGVTEGWTDEDGTEYYDYGTGTVSDDDIFDTHKLGVFYYDNLIHNPEYYAKNKGVKGKIVMMTPDEYFDRVAEIFVP